MLSPDIRGLNILTHILHRLIIEFHRVLSPDIRGLNILTHILHRHIIEFVRVLSADRRGAGHVNTETR